MDPTIRKQNFDLIIVVFNITIAVYLFFPGFMSQDSISQYEQSPNRKEIVKNITLLLYI